MSRFEDVLNSVQPIDRHVLEQAKARHDQLTKPLGSLGILEEIGIRLAAIYGTVKPKILGKGVVVFAADHGVTHAGVSAYPKAVTEQMVLNFLRGGAAINVLSQTHNVEMLVVDVGVDADFSEHPKLLKRKVAKGTRNMLIAPAMTPEELQQALNVGIEAASIMIDKGVNLIAGGDMGIGNTTSATALISVLTELSPAELTGRGTGVDDAGLRRKIDVIEKALQFHQVKKEAALELLRCVGGLELAALVGFYVASAARKIAIVLDGFVSHAAALVAVALNPSLKDYLFASHSSQNKVHRKRFDILGVKPLFNFTLRLGEGTGAVLAMPVIESAAAILADMATFAEAGVSEAP
jgi:nicotinate-nucleotide--dimethylbenzimidazole phosphoribosyltransferase